MEPFAPDVALPFHGAAGLLMDAAVATEARSLLSPVDNRADPEQCFI